MMSDEDFKVFLNSFENRESSEHKALESIIKYNYKNLTKFIEKLEESMQNLSFDMREHGKQLITLEADQKSTQKELSEFKKDEKTYGVYNSKKFEVIDKQLDSLRYLHWKILLVGITLISVTTAIIKLVK